MTGDATGALRADREAALGVADQGAPASRRGPGHFVLPRALSGSPGRAGGRPLPCCSGRPPGFSRSRPRGPLGGGSGQGSCHRWLAPPLQVYKMSWVPLVVLEAGSSRHLPEAGLTSAPPLACHCWLAPPLQDHHSIRVPLL